MARITGGRRGAWLSACGTAGRVRLGMAGALCALAVLGWNWARLVPAQGGWTTRLRLRGKAERRSVSGGSYTA